MPLTPDLVFRSLNFCAWCGSSVKSLVVAIGVSIFGGGVSIFGCGVLGGVGVSGLGGETVDKSVLMWIT